MGIVCSAIVKVRYYTIIKKKALYVMLIRDFESPFVIEKKL
jgi:hypothetical protein